MPNSGAERSIAERLEISSGGRFSVTPATTQSPNDRQNDGVASFIDSDDVIYDSRDDDEKRTEIRSWIREKIHDFLREYFQTSLGAKLLKELQSRCTNRRERLDETRFWIYLEDDNPSYETTRKYWFMIGPIKSP
ncbi:MAG: hypothetical protein AAB467_00160 [Patescibacteria group bacterium]